MRWEAAALRYAVLHKFRLRSFGRDEVPKNLIISPGGVATTFLIEWLSEFAEANHAHDADGLKHLPYLPPEIVRTRRILFITGRSDEIVESIARRGWVRMQGGKLGSLSAQLTLGRLQRKRFAAAIARQIAFFEGLDSPNVLVVGYDDLWSRADDIAAHFGIADKRFVEEFPERRARTVSLRV